MNLSNNKKCLIITGGEYSSIEKKHLDSFVIACDKGYEYAKKDGVIPDLIIGDFDSYYGELPNNSKIMYLKPEKDETDTMFALKYATQNGFNDITLTCSLGNRLDHAFANIQSGIFALENDISFRIIETSTEIYFISNSYAEFLKKDGYSLSVFSLSDKCTGVSILGAKYPLKEAVLTNSFPIGVSNEWIYDTVKIEVKEGILAVMMCRK